VPVHVDLGATDPDGVRGIQDALAKEFRATGYDIGRVQRIGELADEDCVVLVEVLEFVLEHEVQRVPQLEGSESKVAEGGQFHRGANHVAFREDG
jgi:hypothetical protein